MIEGRPCKDRILAHQVNLSVGAVEPAVMWSSKPIHDVDWMHWLSLDISQVMLPLPIALVELGHHSHYNDLDNYENFDADWS